MWDRYKEIYGVIRRIPRGRIATYAQVAELAGIPRGGRVAARSLKASQPEHGLPWHRVLGRASVNTARIAILDPVGAALQRQRLEAEGIQVSDRGTVRLHDFGWLPCDAGQTLPQPRRGSTRMATKRR